MTVVYQDSPYAVTLNVSGQKTALSYDMLNLFSTFTQGGTIPFLIRWQYQWKYVETSKGVYDGWGPLDETIDKINGTPGLRYLMVLQGAPKWWCSLAINSDGSTSNVGYGNGVLPDGPAMATFAAKVAARYGNRIAIYQVLNEEADTNINNAAGGSYAAYLFNYAVPQIQPHSSSPIIAGSMRKIAPNGSHLSTWTKNFFTYAPKAGEPAQSLPVAMDIHFYSDNSNIESNGHPSPDPTVTDDSSSPINAYRISTSGAVSVVQSILDTYSPSTQVWILEDGRDLPNNSPYNKSTSPTDLPSQQSRYNLDALAQMHFSGGSKYAVYTILSNTDPKGLCGQAISDMTSYIAADPQWAGTSAPTQYLYQSVDALSFEGTTATAPNNQYFSIMNPTGSNQSWSVTSNQGWLTVAPRPIDGMKGKTLPGSTLAAGQCITLSCSADSTTSGLSTLTTLSGTLTVTIGGNINTITVSLFVTPTAAKPNLTSGAAGPGNGPTFTMAVNAGAPANQTISFKNADSYATWWYAFATGSWMTINTSSGTLAAGDNQNITISITGAVASKLAPGTYSENLTISATPFPPTYTTADNPPPATTQFITVTVKLTVTTAHTPTIAVQLSTSTLLFSAVASGALPASQTFFLHNCTDAAEAWTAAKTASWFTLDHTSSSTNLPKSGSQIGTSPNVQATDYFVITASINTTGLAAGTYTDTITVTLGGSATQTIAVSYVVTSVSSTEIIGASPTTLTLSQVQGSTPVTATTTLTNTGNTSGIWTHTKTYTSGTGWLTISPGTGTLTASGGTQAVVATCTPGTLAPGTYSATLTFKLGTTSANVSVSFTVTATGSPANIAASPASMTFSDVIGQALAAPQTLTLTNTGGQNGTWGATIAYKSGNNWIVLSKTTDTLVAGASEALTVSMNDIGLKIGIYTATISITVGANTTQVAVTLIINPAAVASSTQMTQADLATQYARIMATIVGPQLSILATTYYGGSTNNQVVYGELDALFPWESMSQLHVLKSINDVTAFINAYAYTANVLTDNPVVYYRLSETSGIFASDISGRNMTGTLSNTLGIISGVTLGQAGAIAASSDTAMLFDGSTGNITLPAGVTAANWSNLTVEVWIKPSNVTFTQTAFIVANDAPLSTNLGFMIAISKNAVIFRIGKTSSYYEINQAFTFAASTWYHLAGVFAGTSLTVYLNGNQLATTTVASALVAQTTNVVNIAAKPGVTTNNFPGTLQHPALYKAALSALRIQAHYLGYTTGTAYVALVMADNPQAYYRLNEVSGTTAFDSTANHFDAVMTGTLTYSQVGIIGSDTAISFTATGELVMPAALGAGTWGAMSLEYWINITSGYQHIVIAGDTSGTTIYLNGAVYTSGTGPDTVVVGPEVLYSGSLSAGTLSQVSIYKYVLSAAQVANHFQVGSLGV